MVTPEMGPPGGTETGAAWRHQIQARVVRINGIVLLARPAHVAYITMELVLARPLRGTNFSAAF